MAGIDLGPIIATRRAVRLPRLRPRGMLRRALLLCLPLQVPDAEVAGKEPSLDGNFGDLVRICTVRNDRAELYGTAPYPQEVEPQIGVLQDDYS